MNPDRSQAGRVRPLARRFALLGAVTAAAICGVDREAAAQTTPWPPCDTPNYSPVVQCQLPEVGNQQVMLGSISDTSPPNKKTPTKIEIYPIYYGPWTSAYAQALMNEIPSLLSALSDSTYSAITQTYVGSNGTAAGAFVLGPGAQDATERFGNSLGTSQVQSLLNAATTAGNGPLPIDPDGIYVIFTDNGVGFNAGGQTYCTADPTTGMCGYNTTATVGGKTIHFAVVGSNQSCSYCQWGFQTPHTVNGVDLNGRLDKALSALVHELDEVITDPFGQNGGYYSSMSGLNTQMADFCASQGGRFGYSVNETGRANFHGNGDDFLLQPLRANPVVIASGGVGYCVTGWVGVFANQNFGYSWKPFDLDWAPSDFKGECEPGQTLVGMSEFRSNIDTQGSPHGVMCASENPPFFPQSQACTVLHWDGTTAGTHNCPANTFAAGFATSSADNLDGVLCCPLGNGGHSTCSTTQDFLSAQLPTTAANYDWDWLYLKAGCPGQNGFVGGVTTGIGNGGTLVPLNLTCCTINGQPE